MFHSIRNKILLAILAVTLMTAFSITLVFYFKSAGMIEENYSENLYGRIVQTVDAMDNSLKEIYYINTKGASDRKLKQALMRYQQENTSECLDQLAEILRNCQKQYKDIKSVYLLLPEQQMAVTSDDYPVLKRDISEDIIQKIQTLEQGKSPVLIEDLVHNSQKQLFFIKRIKTDDGKILGYFMTCTRERSLYYEYLEPVCDKKATEAIILNRDMEIVTAPSYSSVGTAYLGAEEKSLENGIWSTNNTGKIHLFYRGNFSECGIYVLVEKNVILKELNEIRTFLAGIFLLFCIAAVILSTYIARKMYRPMANLAKTAEEVGKGNLDCRVHVITKDEIGMLSTEFNTMLDQIEKLIQRVIEEEQLKKDAELEALQYQITPHFMYNTLNSIKFAALIKGEKELGGLIGDFVELLQASINKKGTFITVDDEIHILKNYIHLQEFRYQGSFRVDYDIEEEAGGGYIPRLILQPLVENAILHGMDTKEKTGILKIKAEILDNVLYLQVKDNGRGMTEEQIQKLLHNKTKKTNGLSAIGVANIRERLELYYGNQGGILYESDENGTTAKLFLPIQKD